jgi:hypothetical protein
MRGIEEISAEQEKLKTETLAKNRMLSLLACVYIEIGAVPLLNPQSWSWHHIIYLYTLLLYLTVSVHIVFMPTSKHVLLIENNPDYPD